MVRVDEYDFGRIIVDGKKYNHDVIVFWDGKIEKWWRKEGHKVCVEDIEKILEKNPEIIVFGTGKYGVMKVGSDVKNLLQKENIKCIEKISDDAVKEFNEKVNKSKVVLAIHLTC